ncbi:tetratricopeptide repeat protein [Actinoplanes awajinensis]|uniref:Tetratricopeptide repeat protein n=1 Tax=Actinoplanes awajinensis subsp. mycoplanecinus TaxID=135947 RepID=A0A101J7C7_9ACTN|nr:tetratricopeptide repeat protein [Actinoplanes awajinensis]KUL21584.1 hypothetical protein ADL15_50340 [Actinoplanes awajinensis subsp. mycoplanecinus]
MSAADRAEALVQRYRSRGRDADLEAATAIVQVALRSRPDPLTRAALLRQRAACRQERGELSQARADYEKALALLPQADPLRPVILTELGTVLQDRFDLTHRWADIDRAVALGQQAVTADPDEPMHWVNLGTARHTRHQNGGDDSDDLDEALHCWDRAFALLPESSPFRAAFHDRLTIGHLERGDLETAIEHGRHAVALQTTAVHASNLAAALLERWEGGGDRADVDEAIAVFRSTISGRVRAPDLLAYYAETLVSRYQMYGDVADLNDAAGALNRVRRRPASVRSATGRVLMMRYLAGGARADLDRSIREARAALGSTFDGDVTDSSRTARLSSVLFLRFRRSGRRADLDEAIAAMDAPATDAQVRQLADYHAERWAHDGDPADLTAADDLTRSAGGEQESGPMVAAGLASSLHDAFVTAGRVDDLTESVARHRAALAATDPRSPAYPAMLNNLAMALSEDDPDEAIAVHEQALAAVGPDSPDRPGLISALADAVTSIDPQRAVTLGREAVAALPSGSPERAQILAGLAVALRWQGDLEEAATTYRRALRAMGRNRTARALVRHDYAETLEALGQTAAAGRAFRAAAAEADTPVARLDVSAGWGAWALRAGRWRQAATALSSAAAAHWQVLGAQQSRPHRERWLPRRSAIATGEAYAWMRTGAAARAVAALDGGRALNLSEQLEAGRTADRLRVAGHGDLADRYERATRRFTSLAPVRLRSGAPPWLPRPAGDGLRTAKEHQT